MAERSAIEWTDSTFNPWIGCTKISPGCDHCYAEARMDTRLHVVGWGAGQPRKRTSAANWRLPVKWNRLTFVQCKRCGWRGELAAAGKTGECPVCGWVDHYRVARRRVFCASLADVFDNEVPVQWRLDLLDLIRTTPQLDWLLLTKRVGNVHNLLAEALSLAQDQMSRMQSEQGLANWLGNWVDGEPPANVWLGATIVNRKEMLRDALKLADAPAAVRFWSVEPMLGDLGAIPPKLMPDWVIAGGESGHHARQFDVNWARSIVRQCADAGVPVMVKQLGANVAPMKVEAGSVLERLFLKDRKGGDWSEWPEDLRVREFPDAGRLLDGRTHDGGQKK